MDTDGELRAGSRAPAGAVARRRRTLVGGLLVVSLAGGVLVWSLGGAPASRDAGLVAQKQRPVRLPVVVSPAASTGQQTGSATWDAEARELVYLSSAGYSSSCPPTATAWSDDQGALVIELDADRVGACTADAPPVAVTVRWPTGAPVSLTVSAGGETGPAPIVRSAPTDRSPAGGPPLPRRARHPSGQHVGAPGDGRGECLS